jgi:hypothetical protein
MSFKLTRTWQSRMLFTSYPERPFRVLLSLNPWLQGLANGFTVLPLISIRV